MRKNVIISLILSVLLLGFGTAFAATSQIDNLAGGAGYNYFQASAAGDVTLLNIQNIDITPIVAHVVFYNLNSIEIVDFKVALSGRDNWGASITGNGTTITITPQTPCFYAGVDNGCFAPMVRNALADASGMQMGYVSVTIAAGDSIWYGGDGNGDPRNDGLITGTIFRFRDVLATRAAYLGPASSSAFALNGWMMQGFVNIPVMNEATAGIGGSWDSIADAGVGVFYNCDGDTGDVFPGTDDANGPRIDSWELLLTDYANWAMIADDTNGGGVGDTYFTAFGGAATGASTGSVVGASPATYWGRYNVNASVGTQTWLVTVFPANAGPNNAPACGLSSRTISGISCDDNEFCPSFTYTPAEVAAVQFGPSGPPPSGTSGEVEFTASAPMAGFTYTENAAFADIYPLVATGKWVNAADGYNDPFFGTGHALDAATTEVIQLSLQESYQ